MKNIIIAIMASYIYYTEFCVIEMPVIIPFVALIVWMTLSEIDNQVEVKRKAKMRGQKLINRLRGII